MPVHQRNTSTTSSRGNIFSAIRRNQELEREKRLAQRKSFIDPAIQQVQGKPSISVIQAIRLSKPIDVTSQLAKPISIKQQVATTNISPQEKNLRDLQSAFPPSVTSVIQPSLIGASGKRFETVTTLQTQAGGERTLRGSQALQDRIVSNFAKSTFSKSIFGDLSRTIENIRSVFR